jgi:transcriptional regulator with XRE-family HTH domain
MNLKQIGTNIKTYRKEKKMTQAQLAELAQISVIHVSHIENGTVAMSLETMLSICRALNTTPNDILLGEYLYPDVDDMLFNEPSNHLSFDDKLLLQQIFKLMETRRKP